MFRRPQSGNWADACDEDEAYAPPTRAAGNGESSASNAPPAATNFWASRNQSSQSAPVNDKKQDGAELPPRRDAPSDRYDRQDNASRFQDSARDTRDVRDARDARGYDRFGGNARGYDRRDNSYRQDSYGRRDRDRDEGYGRRDRDEGYGRRDREEGYGQRRDHYDQYSRDAGGRGLRNGGGPSFERRAPERHQGYVTTIRSDGGFGFLHCLELQQDVFFHESEVPAREVDAENAEPKDLPHVQIGDELSFELSINRRNGKESAVNITRLAKGTIVVEDIAEEWSTGTVTKGLPPKHKHQHQHFSGGSRRETELSGSIELAEPAPAPASAKEDESTPPPSTLRKHFVRFTSESFAGNHAPRVGDDVQFKIAVHKQTGVKRAVELTVTCSASSKREAAIEAIIDTLPRETGIVVSVKGHGGIIQCLNRAQDAHFVHADKANPLAEGDNVSFFILPEDLQAEETRGNTQRHTAIRLEKLPAGSVVFEEVVATDVTGVVVVAPKEHLRHTFGKHNNSQPPSAHGQIRIEGDETLLVAQLNDFTADYTPKEGDTVIVDVLQNHRRQQKSAVRIRLDKLNPEGREMGTVSSIKEDFGFIKCVDRHGDMYFRLSEVLPTTGNLVLRIGAEVSFDIVQSRGKDGLRASRVQVLPKDSIQWEIPFLESVSASLVTVPPKYINKKDQQPGKLRFTSTVCPLAPFPDLKAQLLEAFSEVNAETAPLELKHLSPAQRSALHTFASVVGGLDVQEKGKSGVVVSVLEGAASPDWSAQVAEHEVEAEYSLDAIQDVRYEPHEGDSVTCAIVVTKRGHHLVAKSIAEATGPTVPGEGFVSVVKAEGYGFIETTHGDSLFYHFSDVVDKQTKLKEGDEVSFVIKTVDKKRKAVAIQQLPAGTLPPIQVREVEAVVVRTSHRQKQSHHHNHHGKNKQLQSTAGKLKTIHTTSHDDDEVDGRNSFLYHVEDQVAASAILRPGDVVRCQVRGNSKQAIQIALVTSNAKQGIVEVVGVKGGTIAVNDSEDKVTYVNKSVLGGSGALGVGDKVEFAITPASEDKPAMATHIVRLEGADRKGGGVNSSLRRALKETGAGVSTSRMARGPDGTKGFASGWQSEMHAPTTTNECRWPSVLAAVEDNASAASHIDEHGFTLLHYMCMNPELPPAVLQEYLHLVPPAVALLSQSKSLFAIAKCSKLTLDVLARHGYPKAVKVVPKLPPRWQQASSCSLCKTTFNTFNRRHHCRQCGHSVCASHSTQRAALSALGLHTKTRVCDQCWQMHHVASA